MEWFIFLNIASLFGTAAGVNQTTSGPSAAFCQGQIGFMNDRCSGFSPNKQELNLLKVFPRLPIKPNGVVKSQMIFQSTCKTGMQQQNVSDMNPIFDRVWGLVFEALRQCNGTIGSREPSTVENNQNEPMDTASGNPYAWITFVSLASLAVIRNIQQKNTILESKMSVPEQGAPIVKITKALNAFAKLQSMPRQKIIVLLDAVNVIQSLATAWLASNGQLNTAAPLRPTVYAAGVMIWDMIRKKVSFHLIFFHIIKK